MCVLMTACDSSDEVYFIASPCHMCVVYSDYVYMSLEVYFIAAVLCVVMSSYM